MAYNKAKEEFTIGRFLIPTDGIISECRKQVHILMNLPKILRNPK